MQNPGQIVVDRKCILSTGEVRQHHRNLCGEITELLLMEHTIVYPAFQIPSCIFDRSLLPKIFQNVEALRGLLFLFVFS